MRGYYNKYGTLVPPKYRGDANISESRELTTLRAGQRLRRITGFSSPLAFLTDCWWCGARVHFYRSEDGGCALFDMLGYPWPIHGCWDLYREQSLSRIANELGEYHFDGRKYSQDRQRLTKPGKQLTLSVTGFVDRTPNVREATFSSWRNTIGGTFRELRFVPDSDATVFHALQIPTYVSEHFPAYSHHTIDAVWKEHGGRWSLFLQNFRRLRTRGRADKIVRGAVSAESECFYCGSDLTDFPWGFDTNYRTECRECGTCRRTMTGDEYVAYIKNCFNRIRKAK